MNDIPRKTIWSSIVDGNTPSERIDVINQAVREKATDAIPYLLKAVSDKNKHYVGPWEDYLTVSSVAIHALGELRVENAVTLLEEIRRNGLLEDWENATAALVKLGKYRLDDIKNELWKEEDYKRISFCHICVDVGNIDAKKQLMSILADTKESRRMKEIVQDELLFLGIVAKKLFLRNKYKIVKVRRRNGDWEVPRDGNDLGDFNLALHT